MSGRKDGGGRGEGGQGARGARRRPGIQPAEVHRLNASQRSRPPGHSARPSRPLHRRLARLSTIRTLPLPALMPADNDDLQWVEAPPARPSTTSSRDVRATSTTSSSRRDRDHDRDSHRRRSRSPADDDDGRRRSSDRRGDRDDGYQRSRRDDRDRDRDDRDRRSGRERDSRDRSRSRDRHRSSRRDDDDRRADRDRHHRSSRRRSRSRSRSRGRGTECVSLASGLMPRDARPVGTSCLGCTLTASPSSIACARQLRVGRVRF